MKHVQKSLKKKLKKNLQPYSNNKQEDTNTNNVWKYLSTFSPARHRSKSNEMVKMCMTDVNVHTFLKLWSWALVLMFFIWKWLKIKVLDWVKKILGGIRFQTLCGSAAVWKHWFFWVGPPRWEQIPAAMTAILCNESALICCQMLGKQKRLYCKRLCKYMLVCWNSLFVFNANVRAWKNIILHALMLWKMLPLARDGSMAVAGLGRPRHVALVCSLSCFGNDLICWQLITVKATKHLACFPL